MVKIYAHRGASSEFPENTLPAFARAIELSADGIELDVHLSSDGVPVVIHDDSVDRTTNGKGAVADLTLEYLQKLDAGNGATLPTLEEVLDLVAGKLHVDIEVKAGNAADEVVKIASSFPHLEFAISSFNHEALRHVRRTSAGVELWPLTPVVSDDTISTAKELGAPQIAVYDKMLNEEIMQSAQQHGIDIWVWTVNEPVRAAQLMKWGAVGICTDDPATLIAALR